ncbi:MAG: hypothetical protein IJT21_03055 [Synergistaceae bacterium]|nr:hypothetical protein [Synergistaceae bacterium]
MNGNVVFIRDFEGNKEINRAIYFAYKKSKESGNKLLDFNGSVTVWEKDVPEIAETLRNAGVREFTISSQSSNLLINMAAFTKCGFKVSGIIEVKSIYQDWYTKEFPIIPAVLL